MPATRTARLVTALAIAAIAAATLSPLTVPEWTYTRPCLFLCGEEGLADFLVNIVLYLPLGVGLALSGLGTRAALLAAFFISAGVEAVQIPLGRDSSAGDVVANTLGVGLGFLLTAYAARWLRPTRRTAALLGLAWSGLVVVAVGFTGVLMRPGFPPGEWYGQWNPRFGHMEHWGGRVLSATVGGLDVPSWKHARPDSLRSLLSAGAPVEVTATAAPPPPGAAPIFGIADGRQRSMIMLAADGTDLVFSYRQRSAVLRLDRPDIRLRGWLSPLAPGDTFSLRLWRDSEGFCLAVDTRAACRLGFPPGRGWAVFYSISWAPQWAITALDVLWMGLLFLPLGIWFTAGYRVRSPAHRSPLTIGGWWIGMAISLAALIFLPGVVGLQPSGVVDFLGVAAGLEVGFLLRRSARRQRPANP